VAQRSAGRGIAENETPLLLTESQLVTSFCNNTECLELKF